MIKPKSEHGEGVLLLIDKPKDFTSARVVNIIKRKLNVRKAGHSGTLDPKATGLLIVCTEKKTKMLNDLLGADKEYEGIMILGETTPSFDSETEVVETRPLNGLEIEKVFEVASSFLGEISQIPPMYSAIKHKGKPLYKYARKNKEIGREPRNVTIKEFDVIKIDLPEVSFRVKCSKGTYIRSLISDFGEKLGTGAYLKELRRTRIGELSVEDSVSLEEFLNERNKPD